MQTAGNLFSFLRRQPLWRWAAALALLAALGLVVSTRGGRAASKVPLFAARHGPLDITVLQGGSLQALDSQEIKCEVRAGNQGAKILKIVEEGYYVTEDDLKTNKVLVELDSSDLQKQIVQQEIQYQTAIASLIDAQQNYEIQLSQNLSDIKDAEQKARFAHLDFDKFLGESVAARVIHEVGLDKLFAAASTNDLEAASAVQDLSDGDLPLLPPPATNATPAAVRHGSAMPGAPTGGAKAAIALPAAPPTAGSAASGSNCVRGSAQAAASNSVPVDFSPYADIDKLGDGEAKQKLRKFQDDLQVAQKDLEQAKTTLEGTRRLFAKGFVTQTELQRDEITYENKRLAVQTADSARDLFLRYDFVKSAEDALSKYAQAVRELDKARRIAISKLAQAKAKLRSARAQHEVQLQQRNDLKEQVEKCVLGATKGGLVVYGSADDDSRWDDERIREGATVRERQVILTIPDLSRMIVKVKIHEGYIKKIRKGQKARVTVDAYPDKVLAGEVTKVAVLPDSQNRWLTPDLKVYLTTISVEGTHDWVKPGMSAKVEILVNRIGDCIYVPVQAISPDADKQVCYVSRGLKPERREVQTGEFNDEFIEIKGGLNEGELVLLRAPETGEAEKTGAERKPPEGNKTPATGPASPAAATVQANRT
jgi:multidrug resistance efflux pump